MGAAKQGDFLNSIKRYATEHGERRVGLLGRDAAAVLLAIILAFWLWPLRTVPTGHRGVVTVGGAIRNIEPEGFLLVWPWQRLSIFNIRAEEATVEGAEGSTSDTQPVKVSLTKQRDKPHRSGRGPARSGGAAVVFVGMEMERCACPSTIGPCCAPTDSSCG